MSTDLYKELVIGLDPGTSNYAYSIMEAWIHSTSGNKKSVRFNVLRTGILASPIKAVDKNLYRNLLTHLMEIESLSLDLDANSPYFAKKPECIGMERFQSRGNHSKLLELVNLMTGSLILKLSPDTHIEYFPASSWKNCFNSKHDIKEVYKRITCTAHELDATLIGIAGYYRKNGLIPFQNFGTNYLNSAIRQVQDASTTAKRIRRIKG